MTYAEAKKVVQSCNDDVQFLDHGKDECVSLDGVFTETDLEALMVVLLHRKLARMMEAT